MSQFEVVLRMAGKEYKQRADSINEALTNLGLDWNNVKMKGIITVSRDDASYEHFFPLSQLKRIMGNKMARMLWAKRLTYLLGEGKKTNKLEKLEI